MAQSKNETRAALMALMDEYFPRVDPDVKRSDARYGDDEAVDSRDDARSAIEDFIEQVVAAGFVKVDAVAEKILSDIASPGNLTDADAETLNANTRAWLAAHGLPAAGAGRYRNVRGFWVKDGEHLSEDVLSWLAARNVSADDAPSVLDGELDNVLARAKEYSRGYDAGVSSKLSDTAGLVESLKVAMLGTTDGGFISDDDSIPAGEMFRLAAEWVESHIVDSSLVRTVTGGVVTDDMVEVAARTWYETKHRGMLWDAISPQRQEHWRGAARTALTAVMNSYS